MRGNLIGHVLLLSGLTGLTGFVSSNKLFKFHKEEEEEEQKKKKKKKKNETLKLYFFILFFILVCCLHFMLLNNKDNIFGFLDQEYL